MVVDVVEETERLLHTPFPGTPQGKTTTMEHVVHGIRQVEPGNGLDKATKGDHVKVEIDELEVDEAEVDKVVDEVEPDMVVVEVPLEVHKAGGTDSVEVR